MSAELIVGLAIGAMCIFIVIATCLFLSFRKKKMQEKRMINMNNSGKYDIDNSQVKKNFVLKGLKKLLE